MKSLLLLVVCTLAWLAWIPAALLQKKARGDGGGTSVLPVIPLFPIGGWLAGLSLDLLCPGAGLYLVGGTHLVLTSAFLGSALLSAARIRAGGGSSDLAAGDDGKGP